MTNENKIKLQQWWLEELKALMQKVEAQEAKRKSRKSKELSEYESVDDILEAYGMGMISEKKKDRLLDAWDQVSDDGDSMYQAKLEMLQEFRDEANEIICDLGREGQ